MVFIGLPSRRRLSSASCVSERGKDWVTRWRHICKQAAWFTHTVPARSRTSRGCGTWDYRGRSRRQERRSLFAKTLGSAATITKTETVSRQAGRGKKKKKWARTTPRVCCQSRSRGITSSSGSSDWQSTNFVWHLSMEPRGSQGPRVSTSWRDDESGNLCFYTQLDGANTDLVKLILLMLLYFKTIIRTFFKRSGVTPSRFPGEMERDL